MLYCLASITTYVYANKTLRFRCNSTYINLLALIQQYLWDLMVLGPEEQRVVQLA